MKFILKKIISIRPNTKSGFQPKLCMNQTRKQNDPTKSVTSASLSFFKKENTWSHSAKISASLCVVTSHFSLKVQVSVFWKIIRKKKEFLLRSNVTWFPPSVSHFLLFSFPHRKKITKKIFLPSRTEMRLIFINYRKHKHC